MLELSNLKKKKKKNDNFLKLPHYLVSIQICPMVSWKFLNVFKSESQSYTSIGCYVF